MIRGVIFDLDGLLIDSEPLWQEAEIEVFGAVGVALDHEMCRRTTGLRIDEVVSYWYSQSPWQGMDCLDVEARVKQRVYDLILERGQPKEGVDEIFRFFAGKGVAMAIASSSALTLIEAVVQKFDLGSYLSVIHSAQFEPFGKPHPGVYLSTVKKLGLSPGQCLAFEDSPNGVKAAKNAGIHCVCVPDGHVDIGAVSIADMCLDSLIAFGEQEWGRVCSNAA